MKSILDRSFIYTNAASTDLRKTFARLKREREKEEKREDVMSLAEARRKKERKK